MVPMRFAVLLTLTIALHGATLVIVADSAKTGLDRLALPKFQFA